MQLKITFYMVSAHMQLVTCGRNIYACFIIIIIQLRPNLTIIVGGLSNKSVSWWMNWYAYVSLYDIRSDVIERKVQHESYKNIRFLQFHVVMNTNNYKTKCPNNWTREPSVRGSFHFLMHSHWMTFDEVHEVWIQKMLLD